MKIDPLLFMFIIEAKVILIALVLLLLYRINKLKKSALSDDKVINIVEDEINSLESELLPEITTEDKDKKDEGEKQPVENKKEAYQKKIAENNLSVLKNLSETLKDENPDVGDIIHSISIGVKEATQKNMDLIDELLGLDDLDAPSTMKETKKVDNLQIKELLTKQKRQFADIMGTQEITTELKERLMNLQKEGYSFMDTMERIKQGNADDNEMEKLVRHLENTNKELELCVETLERENARLFKKLKSYEEEFEKMETQFMDIFEITPSLEDSEEIEKLRETIKEKDEEIKDLQKQLKDLENEYMVLYKQIHE